MSSRVSVADLAARVAASAQAHQRTFTPQEGEKELIQIPLDKVDPNPHQPRTSFDEVALKKLADSIKTDGLLQPITVRRSTAGRYEIVCGERRFRAHQMLGEKTIEAILVSMDDAKSAANALAENIARDDLFDFEIAKGIRAIEKDFGTRTKLAAEIGINRQDMYRYLAYFELPAQLIAALNENPGLFGRSACYAIKSAIEKCDDNPLLEDTLTKLIGLLSEQKIDQSAAAAFITHELQSTEPKKELTKPAVEKQPIGAGKKKIGEIKKTEKEYTLRLDRKKLNEEQERMLQEFIQSLCSQPDE